MATMSFFPLQGLCMHVCIRACVLQPCFTSPCSASAAVSVLATVLQQAASSGLQRCLSVFSFFYSNPQGMEARRVERAEAEEEEEEQGDN